MLLYVGTQGLKHCGHRFSVLDNVFVQWYVSGQVQWDEMFTVAYLFLLLLHFPYNQR